MSVRNAIAPFFALSTLALLIGCGNGSGITNPVAPPSGGFSKSNLNGTYVFSVSGLDSGGFSIAMVGTLNANGNSGITGGTMDINDENFTSPLPNLAISGSSSYNVSVDGRGSATLRVSTPFGSSITLDFVLASSSHGFVIQFDGNRHRQRHAGSADRRPHPERSRRFLCLQHVRSRFGWHRQLRHCG